MKPQCKGCGEPIAEGQLRRGDDWHAACFSKAEAEIVGRPKLRLKDVKRVRGLTPTQAFILTAATRSPSGSVGFGRGDRRGTRISFYDDFERPWITAYSNPEFFLKGRKLLEPGNEPHTYRITEAGRQALAHPTDQGNRTEKET